MIQQFYTYTSSSGYGFALGLIFLITSMALAFEFLGLLYKGWIRFMRFLSIHRQGWPPAHCDADGDPVVPDKKT